MNYEELLYGVNDVKRRLEWHTIMAKKYRSVLNALEEGKKYCDAAKMATTKEEKNTFISDAEDEFNYAIILLREIQQECDNL